MQEDIENKTVTPCHQRKQVHGKHAQECHQQAACVPEKPERTYADEGISKTDERSGSAVGGWKTR